MKSNALPKPLEEFCPQATTIPSARVQAISIKGRKIVNILCVSATAHDRTMALATIPKDVELQWEFCYVNNLEDKKPITPSS